MTQKEMDNLYVERFIHSMENNYKDWTMTICSGMDGSWNEYRSPEYTNENGRISFGMGMCNTGAWIDGLFRWGLPFSVLTNPFDKRFWRYKKAERKMKRWLKAEQKRKYLEELERHIADTK